MNYEDFKFVIRYVRRRVACKNCDMRYKNADIYLLGSNEWEILFLLKCPRCGNILFAHAMLNIFRRPEEITVYNPSHFISHNDVLDIHNFLNNFQGDFTSYIQ